MSAEEPVTRLPRTRGFKLAMPQLVRIALTAALLVLLVVIQRPCADSVSNFVTSFGEEGSGAPAQLPRPGTIGLPAERGSAGDSAGGRVEDYETLRPDMSEAELKAAIERARAKAAVRAGDGGSGSAGMGSAGTGSSGSAGSAAPAP